MTARPVVIRFQQDRTIEEVFGPDREKPPFSRFPVFGESYEDILGYVLKHDMLLHLSRGEGGMKLKEIRRELLIVPETILVSMSCLNKSIEFKVKVNSAIAEVE